MSTIATKFTSVASTSGAPSAPNATPFSEAADSIENPPKTDLHAVGKILGPIEEALNESADAAEYPSPPINTPETFSPAASMYKGTRPRGLSTVVYRLAQLKLEQRSSPRKDTDVTSSNRSIVPSIEENDEEENDVISRPGSIASPANTNNTSAESPSSPSPGSIQIALGSPNRNPRIKEYLGFTSKELPVADPDKKASASTEVVAGNDGLHSREDSIKSAKSDGANSGVTEKNTWAEDAEESVERGLQKLEQLATDECTIKTDRSFESLYVERLEKLLAGDKRIVKVSIAKQE